MNGMFGIDIIHNFIGLHPILTYIALLGLYILKYFVALKGCCMLGWGKTLSISSIPTIFCKFAQKKLCPSSSFLTIKTPNRGRNL
jgi:hypothetical protein